MINTQIDDYVYDKISEYIEENYTDFKVNVFDNPPESENNIFPEIIIKSIKDILKSENLNKTQPKYELAYEINIYAIDMNENPNGRKQEIVKSIAALVDYVMSDLIGFRRTARKNLPEIITQVDRIFLRYECIFDEEEKRIYR